MKKLASMLLASVFSTSAIAVPITVEFSGSIYQSDNLTSDPYYDPSEDWSTELSDLFKLGGVISGHFYYESEATPSQVLGSGEDILAEYSLTGFDIQYESFSGGSTGGTLTIDNGYYGDWDQYVVWTDTDDGIWGTGTTASLGYFGLGVYDYTQTLLSDNSIPLFAPDIDTYWDSMIMLGFYEDPTLPNEGTYIVNATVTELGIVTEVPEPSTAWLLTLGLSLMFIKRKRSSK